MVVSQKQRRFVPQRIKINAGGREFYIGYGDGFLQVVYCNKVNLVLIAFQGLKSICQQTEGGVMECINRVDAGSTRLLLKKGQNAVYSPVKLRSSGLQP